MLTILTWLWAQPHGRTSYKAEHVNIWAEMVSRHLAMPHELACVTDTPDGIDPSVRIISPPGDFEDVQTARWANGRPSCYRRLSMFRRDASEIFGERFVCMDLDCVVGGPLDPLFDRGDDLVLFNGTAPSRPYNGSMILMTAGSRPRVYEKFSEAGANEAGQRFAGSDQAWLAHILGPDEATWGDVDGVYWYGREYQRRSTDPRLLFFPGTLKPWSVRNFDLFVRRNYRLTRMREAA